MFGTKGKWAEGGRLASLLSKAEPYTESKLTHTGRESPLKREEEEEEGPHGAQKTRKCNAISRHSKIAPFAIRGKTHLVVLFIPVVVDARQDEEEPRPAGAALLETTESVVFVQKNEI